MNQKSTFPDFFSLESLLFFKNSNLKPADLKKQQHREVHKYSQMYHHDDNYSQNQQ